MISQKEISAVPVTTKQQITVGADLHPNRDQIK